MRILKLTVLTLLLSASSAFACSNPTGTAGEMIFNIDHKVMQFCDGDKWKAMIGGGGGGSTPSGAIMAFDLATCPTGWSVYTAAQGRFLRGIDPDGVNDPSGVRVAGNVQSDAFQGHRHGMAFSTSTPVASWGTHYNVGTSFGHVANGGGAGYGSMNIAEPITDGVNGTPRTANETRPKNVAVLYCRKD